jgi:hypothetical protein
MERQAYYVSDYNAALEKFQTGLAEAWRYIGFDCGKDTF